MANEQNTPSKLSPGAQQAVAKLRQLADAIEAGDVRFVDAQEGGDNERDAAGEYVPLSQRTRELAVRYAFRERKAGEA